MKKFLLSAVAAFTALSVPASAAVTTLTFEGLGNDQPVADFYGPNYIFSDTALAIIDEDAGGTGNFANEPSPNTVMYFFTADNAVLDVQNGFTTGFSFYYTSFGDASVTVYDGLGATGNILAQLDLVAQHTLNCSGDPSGTFCNWTPVGVTFEGTAYSIDFGGAANLTAFDNITFGSEVPGNGGVIPEPATWALMIAGLGLVGAAARRRRLLLTA